MKINELSQMVFATKGLSTSLQISYTQIKAKIVNKLVDLPIQQFPSGQLKGSMHDSQTNHSPAGKRYVAFLGSLAVSVMEKTKTEPDPPAKYEAQIERFGKTNAGEKFLSAFVGDAPRLFYEKANYLVENYLESLDKNEFQSLINGFKNKYSK